MGIIKRFTNRNKRYGYRYNFGRPLLDKRADERMERLQQFVGKETLDNVLSQPDGVVPESILREQSAWTLLDTILWCGRHHKMMLLEYIDADYNLTVRFAGYLSFRRTLAGEILMFAQSYKNGPEPELRSFRLDRIVTVVNTILPYDNLWPIELYM